MITLIVVFCHFAEPIECKILRLVPDATVPVACLKEAEERGAQWVDEHPGWQAVHYICERNVAKQQPT